MSAAKTNTFYKYDAVGNLTNVVHPVSPVIGLAYDPVNRLSTMVDGVGTTFYGYDGVGRVLSEDGPWINDAVRCTHATPGGCAQAIAAYIADAVAAEMANNGLGGEEGERRASIRNIGAL